MQSADHEATTVKQKKTVLMTDPSFTTAGYAVLTEDDPNQKHTVKQSYAPIDFG